MELRPEFVLPMISRILRDTVLPAVDEKHEVAQEQLKLAIGFLDVVIGQLPVIAAFDKDELDRHVSLAGNLCALAANESSAALRSALDGAKDGALPDATRALRTAIAGFVDAVHRSGNGDASRAVHRIMLDFAGTQFLRERALAAAMGFESGAEPVPSIREQLDLPA